jgi:outer membrane protein TolC
MSPRRCRSFYVRQMLPLKRFTYPASGILALTLSFLTAISSLATVLVAHAQTPLPVGDTLRIGVFEAEVIALERARAIRFARLDARDAELEVTEARGGLLPRVSTQAGFTRELQPVNQFAGTQAGDLLGADGPTDWVIFNERARTDGNPETEPISLGQFLERQERARREAGADDVRTPGSPFSVPNQFQAGLSFSQAILAPGAAAQLRAAQAFREATDASLRREIAATLDSVRQAYLSVLLADARVGVIERSERRTTAALAEAERRIDEGIASISERLSSQVELANIRTELIQARLQEVKARNGFRLTLGLPATTPIVLTDPLAIDDEFLLADMSAEQAFAIASELRADLEEARFFIAARQAQVDAARASLQPNLNAVADLNLVGNVPDERRRVRSDPVDPFGFDVERRGIFSEDFWNIGATAGLQLQWNLFEGGALRARVERARVGVREAELQFEQMADVVLLEVEDALAEMRAARERVLIQQTNVDFAEQNYEVSNQRVLQGVATTMERREASTQLDESRLNLLQAIHDYLSARSALLAAVGVESMAGWAP